MPKNHNIIVYLEWVALGIFNTGITYNFKKLACFTVGCLRSGKNIKHLQDCMLFSVINDLSHKKTWFT